MCQVTGVLKGLGGQQPVDVLIDLCLPRLALEEQEVSDTLAFAAAQKNLHVPRMQGLQIAFDEQVRAAPAVGNLSVMSGFHELDFVLFLLCNFVVDSPVDSLFVMQLMVAIALEVYMPYHQLPFHFGME